MDPTEFEATPVAWGQFTLGHLASCAAGERLAELARLAELGAQTEWLRAIERMATKPRGRPSEREGLDAIRDEARSRGVPLVDIVRRNAAVGYLEERNHCPPAGHDIESVVAMLRRTGGTPAIQRLRQQVRSTCRRLSEK